MWSVKRNTIKVSPQRKVTTNEQFSRIKVNQGLFDSPPSAAPHWFPIEVNSKSNAKEEDNHQCGQNEVPKINRRKMSTSQILYHLSRVTAKKKQTIHTMTDKLTRKPKLWPLKQRNETLWLTKKPLEKATNPIWSLK